MKQAMSCLSAALALGLAGVASASQPSLAECVEGSEFIRNAALSRDGGLSGEAFLDRMEQDFVLVRAFPKELRWFARDPNDEAFLLREARQVFEHPEPAEDHRRAFLEDCIDRMTAPESTEANEPKPGATPASS